MKNEIIYRLMNHDSSGEKPEFHKYNIIELNEQFNTKYLSAEEASQADPEYLFTEEEMLDYIDAE